MILAVTPGDPEGIGPEIVYKTWRDNVFRSSEATLLCVGAREPLEKLGADVVEVTEEQVATGKLPKVTRALYLLPAPLTAPKKKGKTLFQPGYQAGWSIETATRLVRAGHCDALVTGPISKERLQRGGFKYPGHTEFLANLCKTKHVTMMLANEQLRVTLVTTHVALKDVSKTLTRALLRRTIMHTVNHLEEWWGIREPRVAVAALNPHAGENGLFGKEEIRVMTPEINALNRSSRGEFTLLGPLPADTLFAKHVMSARQESGGDRYDAVVCMYHDQGLIPVKLLDFPRTVNVTLGLPIVRTSVDHGVGFDIVGTGKADPTSFQSAVRLAIQIVQNQKRSS